MRILITGANGLVGQGVLSVCLDAHDVENVVALGRRPSGRTHPKLVELPCADFATLDAIEDKLEPFDACLYCAGAPPIGTTADVYRHVTLELTTHVAQTLARLNPALTFVYVSGAKSNPASRIMPLRVKGETERALAALPITTVMFRPGGIQPVDGVRSPHPRMQWMYRFGGPAMGLGVRMVPGLMTTTTRVGGAMLDVLRAAQPPAIVENDEINRRGK